MTSLYILTLFVAFEPISHSRPASSCGSQKFHSLETSRQFHRIKKIAIVLQKWTWFASFWLYKSSKWGQKYSPNI